MDVYFFHLCQFSIFLQRVQGKIRKKLKCQISIALLKEIIKHCIHVLCFTTRIFGITNNNYQLTYL